MCVDCGILLAEFHLNECVRIGFEGLHGQQSHGYCQTIVGYFFPRFPNKSSSVYGHSILKYKDVCSV